MCCAPNVSSAFLFTLLTLVVFEANSSLTGSSPQRPRVGQLHASVNTPQRFPSLLSEFGVHLDLETAYLRLTKEKGPA